MADRLIDRSDGILIRLDKRFGKPATYRVPTGSTFDVVTGQTVVTFDDTPGIKVRPAQLTVTERSNLSQAGFAQFDQAWKLRKALIDDVRPGHIISTGGFIYEVVQGGVQLDELQLEWTVFTRRRR